MAKIAFNKHKTDFPPWSVAFDGRGYLYVGGGGGDQREVPNKLIVLDVSSRQQVEQVAELQVSSDSISSLDVLATAPDQSVVYGAVNSSASDKGNGVNEHLRAYQVKLPARRKNSEKVQEIGEIKEVSKTCLFSQSYAQSKDGFQRITKLSRSVRSKNGDRSTRKRLLALASSLSNISEILITRGTTVAPTASDVVLKWSPIQNREANDLDLIDGDEPGQYNFLLCTNHEIYFLPLSLDPETLKPKAPLTEPVCVWTSPIPDYYEKRSIRPKYRSIQFLSSDLVCLLANVGSGSELQVLRLFNLSKAEIILRKKLPRAAGQAVSMNVSWLDEDVTGYQVVITVAAQKSDVLVYTVDIPGPSKAFQPAFKLYKELSVSDAPMRAAHLSPFFRPTSNSDTTKSAGTQYLRLASISLENQVTIDYLPLNVINDKPGSRYVLQKAKSGIIGSISLPWLAVAFIIVINLLLLQSYLSQSSGSSTSPQLPQFLPQSWQNALIAYRERTLLMGSPLVRQVNKVTHTHASQKLLDMLHSHHHDTKHLPDPAKKAIILSAPEEGTGLSTEVHENTAEVLKQDATAKKWEELSHTQQQQWKEKLKKAGAWSADYGETIFKGVFFSELAGAVGRAAAEAIGG